MRAKVSAMAALALLAGCGEGVSSKDEATTTETASPASDTAALGVDGPSAPPLVAKLAYTYALRYRLPGARIDDVQQAQQDRCDALGAARCIVLGATLEGRDGAFGDGSLELLVAPQLARPLTRELNRIALAAEGDILTSRIDGAALDAASDDADAAAANAAAAGDDAATLVNGARVVERVEGANRLAAARADADAARRAAAELRRRLAMSRVSVAYESVVPLSSDRARPLTEALARVGGVFSSSLAVLVTLGAGALPFALVALAAWAITRRTRRRAALPL